MRGLVTGARDRGKASSSACTPEPPCHGLHLRGWDGCTRGEDDKGEDEVQRHQGRRDRGIAAGRDPFATLPDERESDLPRDRLGVPGHEVGGMQVVFTASQIRHT